ncbi:ASKHA domain-containing protein [Verrucomicrobiota bacterium]
MKHREISVTFQPSGRRVHVLEGTKLLEAAGRAGIILQTPCGGNGSCGKCLVKVVSGMCSGEDERPSALSPELFEQGYRLACQTAVDSAAVVEVPVDSTFESQQRILVGDSGEKGRFDPVVRKVHVELPEPSGEDVRSDLARLRDAIGEDVAISPDLIRIIPTLFRRHEWKATAVLADSRLIGLEQGDTSKRAFGVALDIGTTTVVGTVFDLTTGVEVGVASQMNAQIAHGDDVVSRILKIRENPPALHRLQQAVLRTVNEIISELLVQAGVSGDSIYDVVIAGNSTMQQIFCGFDPSALGELPFVQVFDRAQKLSAAGLGLRTSPGAAVYVFPQIGGFVGGDTVAGMVASRLDQWDSPVVLVDIGTNGEIVLAHDGRIMATSTAAGPAFEGARITQGMRAAVGAIEKVIVGDDVVVNVIGNVKSMGICGTALIDAVAGLLRKGIVDSTGRILPAEEAPPELPEALRRRLVPSNGETSFILAWEDETASGQPIRLWQKDLRELQLASGAIRAGIHILLRRAGVGPEDLGAVLLAGAFGNFIRRNNARRIGLLPQIPCDRIRFIGNAASLGAKMVLLSAAERAYAASLRHRTEHVDLSRDSEFQMEFGTAMLFPETEADACGAD